MEQSSIELITQGIHNKYIRRKNTDGFRMKYALSNTERKELVRECGVYCLALFEYYLRIASIENLPITDADAAEYFGWSENGTKKHRIKLQKAGWFYRDIATSSRKTKKKIYIYYLGKKEVTSLGLNQEKPA